MLLDDRPATASVQGVVMDALARLPQGVGTKTDLQALLADSQYFNSACSPQFVATALSDSLDRLSATGNPVASYFAPGRLWSYLLRNRNADDLP